MKKTLLALTLVSLVAPTLEAASLFRFNISPLNTVTNDALPTSLAINYAELITVDTNGDPVTPYYAVDSGAGAVTASDPNLSGYGAAIDGDALDGLASPVMFTFGQPLDITGFSAALDDSTFGLTSFGATPIEFYDGLNVLVGTITVDQNIALFNATGAGPYTAVKTIVFSSGAFYDNVEFTAVVPEPSAMVLGALGALGLVVRRRR